MPHGRIDGSKKAYLHENQARSQERVRDTDEKLLDNRAGFGIVECRQQQFELIGKIYADGDYRGELIENVKNKLGYDMEINNCANSDKAIHFKPLSKRRIIGRTFA
jgi:hypothetical protein